MYDILPSIINCEIPRMVSSKASFVDLKALYRQIRAGVSKKLTAHLSMI